MSLTLRGYSRPTQLQIEFGYDEDAYRRRIKTALSLNHDEGADERRGDQANAVDFYPPPIIFFPQMGYTCSSGMGLTSLRAGNAFMQAADGATNGQWLGLAFEGGMRLAMMQSCYSTYYREREQRTSFFRAYWFTAGFSIIRAAEDHWRSPELCLLSCPTCCIPDQALVPWLAGVRAALKPVQHLVRLRVRLEEADRFRKAVDLLNRGPFGTRDDTPVVRLSHRGLEIDRAGLREVDRPMPLRLFRAVSNELTDEQMQLDDWWMASRDRY